jgi:hypothetical protein
MVYSKVLQILELESIAAVNHEYSQFYMALIGALRLDLCARRTVF